MWCHSLVSCLWLNVFISVSLPRNSQCVCLDPSSQGTMLPRWELSFYLLASLGFHLYSFYEVYKASRGKVPTFVTFYLERKGERKYSEVEDSGRLSSGLGMTWTLGMTLLSPLWGAWSLWSESTRFSTPIPGLEWDPVRGGRVWFNGYWRLWRWTAVTSSSPFHHHCSQTCAGSSRCGRPRLLLSFCSAVFSALYACWRRIIIKSTSQRIGKGMGILLSFKESSARYPCHFCSPPIGQCQVLWTQLGGWKTSSLAWWPRHLSDFPRCGRTGERNEEGSWRSFL